MSSSSRPAGKLSAREICILALMGAMMFALQVAMAPLPNIHATAALIILTAVFFSWRAMYSTAVFVLLEGLMYGFGLWWLSYLYIWPIFTAIAVLLRKNDSALIWAVIAATFGLCYGALCAIPYLIVGGLSMAVSYWVAGIPFDLAHCAGNFVLTLVLYKPLGRVLRTVLKP